MRKVVKNFEANNVRYYVSSDEYRFFSSLSPSLSLSLLRSNIFFIDGSRLRRILLLIPIHAGINTRRTILRKLFLFFYKKEKKLSH